MFPPRPRSSRETSLWLTPARSATARWLMPAACRPARIRAPISCIAGVTMLSCLDGSDAYVFGSSRLMAAIQAAGSYLGLNRSLPADCHRPDTQTTPADHALRLIQ